MSFIEIWYISRTYPNMTRDAYVYSFKNQSWTIYPNQFNATDMTLGSATLRLLPLFRHAISFDGVGPSSPENHNFNGAIFKLQHDNPHKTSYSWAGYSFPASMDVQQPRLFPAAMWVQEDKVCQHT